MASILDRYTPTVVGQESCNSSARVGITKTHADCDNTPISLLRVSLLRFVDSTFLINSLPMAMRTPPLKNQDSA